MNEQLSIFEWMAAQEDPRSMSKEETVEYIGNALGLIFKFNNFFGEYQAKVGKIKLAFSFDHYFESGEPFIGTDACTSHSGMGSPCDDVEEVIEFYKKAIPKLQRELKGRKNEE